MKEALAGLAVAVLLGARGQVKQEAETRMDLMEVRTVEFPARIAADAPMNIIVEVGCPCSRFISPFGEFKAARTATALSLQAFTEAYTELETPPPPCPPVMTYGKYTYTDPGTPARTNPFEIIVNGKSWGKVEIKWDGAHPCSTIRRSWQDGTMKNLLSGLGLALLLTSCGTPLLPRTQPLGIAGVEFAPTIGPTDSLTLTLRYGVGCGDFDQQVTKTSRAATGLQLSATVKTRNVFLACNAQYIERTLEYTDPGTPARTSPFEIIVNGKSYGSVTIK